MKKYSYIILFVFLVCSQLTLQAEIQDTLKILFVGNSFTYSNNLAQVVSIISQQSETYLHTQKSTAPGARLAQHWHGHKGLSSKSLIETGKFDIVILQDHSKGSIRFPDSSRYYLNLFVEACRANGATPYLFQTWAYKNEEKMLDTITAFYGKLSHELSVNMLPVGEVWQTYQTKPNALDLYDEDGVHPGKYGTFLTALTVIKALLLKTPENIPSSFKTTDWQGEDVYLMHIDEKYIPLFLEVVGSR